MNEYEVVIKCESKRSAMMLVDDLNDSNIYGYRNPLDCPYHPPVIREIKQKE